MANDFRTLESHSAEYFGETRDYWWNADFLELIARRFSLDRVQNLLDVGCGVGHWTGLLTRITSENVRIFGIDRDPLWIQEAMVRAGANGYAQRASFQTACAEKLPFDDDTFDLVTCQTVLIHTADPDAVIGEMIRVARPGGLILVAEPNNISRALVFDSVTTTDPVDVILARVRLQLICERGKTALGEGNNSIGDLLPGFFAARGLANIRVYLSDKVNAVLPPYQTPEQRALLDEGADLAERDFWIWSRGDTRRYFSAGGGNDDEFDLLWSHALGGAEAFKKSLADQTYYGTGAALGYLIAGTKPGPAPDAESERRGAVHDGD